MERDALDANGGIDGIDGIDAIDAIVLAGGRAARLRGTDKAALEVGGSTLLDRAIAAVGGAVAGPGAGGVGGAVGGAVAGDLGGAVAGDLGGAVAGAVGGAGTGRVVVVGDERPTAVPVLWTREHPPYGGPVAALYAGLDALRRDTPVRLGPPGGRNRARMHGSTPAGGLVIVLAVDMPAVTAGTVRRLVRAAGRGTAARGSDGAVLTDDGRRHLAMVVRREALDRVRPDVVEGAAMRGLWAALDLAEVPARGSEAGDVDTEGDLSTLAKVLEAGPQTRQIGSVNLHDWIDEMCDVLDVDVEVDEGLLLDLAKVVADNVVRMAAPVTTYVLGYAAGLQEADPDGVERLAARVQALAEGWDRPAGSKDPVDIEDDVPDDSAVDHTGDRFDG